MKHEHTKMHVHYIQHVMEHMFVFTCELPGVVTRGRHGTVLYSDTSVMPAAVFTWLVASACQMSVSVGGCANTKHFLPKLSLNIELLIYM